MRACLDLVPAPTNGGSGCFGDLGSSTSTPEIGTELMRHMTLSWENDVLKQDLITWQDAKMKGTSGFAIVLRRVQEGHRHAGL